MKYFLLFAIFAAVSAGKTRYDGYKVFRATPSTIEQVKLLKELEQSNLGVIWFNYGKQKNKIN